MGKGNGDDKSVQDVKDQMVFLDEVKALAKKHGIKIGNIPGMPGGIDPTQQKRDLKVQVLTRGDQVIVDFGQSVSWMAMNASQATKFAATVIKQVQNIQSIGAVGGEAEAPAADETETEDDKKSEVDKPEK